MAVFEKKEFIHRLNTIKKVMSDTGIEVMITLNPANMNYISGYDGYSFYVPQGVIVLLDEEEPVWAGRGLDVKGAQYTTWMKDENVKGYPDDYVQSDVKHPMNFFANVLKEKGYAQSKIGIEMNQEFFMYQHYVELKNSLPDATLIDVSFIVNKIRMIKSETELEYMKQSAQITDQGVQTAIDKIDVGVRESDVAADVYHALIKGTDLYSGDYPSIIPLMPAADKTSAPHLSWSDRKYQEDEIIHLELSGCRHRYHAPLARTVYIGNPPDRYMDIVKAVIEGLNAMLDFIKPGIACEEVEKKWREATAKTGLVKESRVGYPIGLGYPPDWGEQTASFRPGDKTILQPNMTFHLLPAMWQDQYSFIISESIIITENGCEAMSALPRKLFVK